MSLTQSITDLISPAVTEAGFFLEEVQIASPGSHRIVTCIVDGDASLNLDQVTSVSRVISELLDEAPFMGETPFTLEVTSPGVDRPLTHPRHFAKNVDRLLKIIKLDGSEITGRILSNTDHDVTLTVAVKKETTELTVSLTDIKRAVVEIEFNRKDDK